MALRILNAFLVVALGLSAALVLVQRVAAADPVEIGVITPLSGAAAVSARYAAIGAAMAVVDLNHEGGLLGRPVALVVEDNQSTPAGTVEAFERMVARPGLVAVIAPIKSDQDQAILAAARERGRPLLVGGTAPTLTEGHNPWVFRCRASDLFSARAIAAYGTGTLGRKRWVIIRSNDLFGRNGAEGLTRELARSGLSPLAVIAIDPATRDIQDLPDRLAAAAPDAVATYIAGDDLAGRVAVAARDPQAPTLWIGTASLVGFAARRIAHLAVEDAVAVVDFVDEANEQTRQFAERFHRESGIGADANSAYAYDAVHLIAAAVAASRSVAPEAIRDGLHRLPGWTGLQGHYRFDAAGEGLHGMNIVRLHDGRIDFLQRLEFD